VHLVFAAGGLLFGAQLTEQPAQTLLPCALQRGDFPIGTYTGGGGMRQAPGIAPLSAR